MGSVGLIGRICLRVLVGSGSVSMMRLSGYGSLTWNIQRYGKHILTPNMVPIRKPQKKPKSGPNHLSIPQMAVKRDPLHRSFSGHAIHHYPQRLPASL